MLRQAWLEHIRPVLLINKMDRLISELKLSPGEGYTHLQQLLEQVNAVMAQLISGEILKKSADADTPKDKIVQEVSAIMVRVRTIPGHLLFVF